MTRRGEQHQKLCSLLRLAVRRSERRLQVSAAEGDHVEFGTGVQQEA